MVAGWFVVPPPLGGGLTVAAKKLQVVFTGANPVDGSVSAFALKKPVVAMTGLMRPDGSVATTLKKLAVSISGEEQQFGSMAMQLSAVSPEIKQDLFTGAIESTLMPARLAFALQDQGDLVAALATVGTNLAGIEEFTGTLAARLAVAQQILAGAHSQDGVLAAALKKVTTSLMAPPSVISTINATFTTTRTITTGTLPSWTPQENDLVCVYAHVLQAAIGATITVPADWTLALSSTPVVASRPFDVLVYHRVTAAEATAATTSWTLTNLLDASRSGRKIAFVVRGVDPASAIGAGATTISSTSSNSVSLSGITPVDNGSLILAGVGGNSLSTTTTYTLPGAPWSLVGGLSSSSNAVTALLGNSDPGVAGVSVSGLTIPINRTDDWSGFMCEFKSAA